jgi:hypothetical protein
MGAALTEYPRASMVDWLRGCQRLAEVDDPHADLATHVPREEKGGTHLQCRQHQQVRWLFFMYCSEMVCYSEGGPVRVVVGVEF